jgi:hypothetical protein
MIEAKRTENHEGIGPLIPSGPNYEAWHIKPLSEAEIQDFDGLARNIIGHAILAASTHNVQPWRFGINSETKRISFCVNKDCILPASDATGRQAFISTGCALTNAEVAARNYGFEPQITYTPSADQLSAAQMTLEYTGQRSDQDLFSAIPTRAVNRSEYDSQRPIPDEILAKMQACVIDPELELHIITNKTAIRTIALAQEQADNIVMHINKFRKELGLLLLPNNSLEGRGMPGHNFGFIDKDALELHQQLMTGGKLDPHLASGLPVSDRRGIISSPFIGIICIAEARRDLQVKAGQAWQRMALITEKHGVNMSIHAALAEVELSNLSLKKILGINYRPTIIFRAGYATESRPHSPRLPVEEVSFYEKS